MKIVINPKYLYLEPFIRNVLQHDYKADATFRESRNIVDEVTVDGVRLVVKIFKKPTEFNRVIYTWIRPTKAKRSYVNSFRLLDMGIDVPEPIAYIEKRKGLFFHTGCYISKYIDYKAIDDFVDFRPTNFDEYTQFDNLLQQVAHLAVRLHEKGIIDNDFNKDNILYRKNSSGSYSFALIDLNRVKFGEYSLDKAAKDLSNIHLGHANNQRIVEEYCKIRGLDSDILGRRVLKHSSKYKSQAALKDKLLGPLGLRKKR